MFKPHSDKVNTKLHFCSNSAQGWLERNHENDAYTDFYPDFWTRETDIPRRHWELCFTIHYNKDNKWSVVENQVFVCFYFVYIWRRTHLKYTQNLYILSTSIRSLFTLSITSINIRFYWTCETFSMMTTIRLWTRQPLTHQKSTNLYKEAKKRFGVQVNVKKNEDPHTAGPR